MQGLPPEESEEYAPFLPNSPEGASPEGVVNNDVFSEIGSSTPLEESTLPVNLLLSVIQDPLLLQINSLGDIVVEDYTRIPNIPYTKSGVDDPPFQSELFRTLVHTAGIFNHSSVLVHYFWRTSSGHDIFDKLGMSPNQPMSSHTPTTSTSYIVPLDHFTGTTSNVVMVSDQLLVGSHTILPLHLTRSTVVPQVTHVFVRSLVITQALIGMPLPSRSSPSLPLGYNALNTSISNPSQSPSRGINLFIPPGYNDASDFVPTPTQVLSRGPNAPPPPSPRRSNLRFPSSSNQVGGTSHSIASGFQILVGGQPQVGVQPQVKSQPQVGGHNLVYRQYTPGLQSQPWNFPFQGNQQLPKGKTPQVNSFVPPNPR
jgi:hypothetical protein